MIMISKYRPQATHKSIASKSFYFWLRIKIFVKTYPYPQ